jgi:hypothetical protein
MWQQGCRHSCKVSMPSWTSTGEGYNYTCLQSVGQLSHVCQLLPRHALCVLDWHLLHMMVLLAAVHELVCMALRTYKFLPCISVAVEAAFALCVCVRVQTHCTGATEGNRVLGTPLCRCSPATVTSSGTAHQWWSARQCRQETHCAGHGSSSLPGPRQQAQQTGEC